MIAEQYLDRKIEVTGLRDFDISQIFDCGQCFRFDPLPDGCIEGVAFGQHVRFEQPDEETLIIHGTCPDEYNIIWKPFLTIDTDYGAIKSDIAAHFAPFDHADIIGAAMKRGGGIRILRQDPWETLCSFIISQNNNIPRIKKIIAALSYTYGEAIETSSPDGSKFIYHTFPTPESLREAGVDAIYALKTGFRAKYIYDAACRVADGSCDLSRVNLLPTAEAADELMKIKGVGIKVASCALLFGFGKTDAFPIDVWIKKVIAKYYPDGIDITALGEYAGIAQQYLFYYERYMAAGQE